MQAASFERHAHALLTCFYFRTALNMHMRAAASDRLQMHESLKNIHAALCQAVWCCQGHNNIHCIHLILQKAHLCPDKTNKDLKSQASSASSRNLYDEYASVHALELAEAYFCRFHLPEEKYMDLKIPLSLATQSLCL